MISLFRRHDLCIAVQTGVDICPFGKHAPAVCGGSSSCQAGMPSLSDSRRPQVLARMDDWIKDRVKEENEAIKAFCFLCLLICEQEDESEATDALLRSGRWEDEAVRSTTAHRGVSIPSAWPMDGRSKPSRQQGACGGPRPPR